MKNGAVVAFTLVKGEARADRTAARRWAARTRAADARTDGGPRLAPRRARRAADAGTGPDMKPIYRIDPSSIVEVYKGFEGASKAKTK